MLRVVTVLGCSAAASALTAGSSPTIVSRAGSVGMSTISDFKATKIDGTPLDLSTFAGKPTLVLNVASLWGTTTRDFTAMNALAEKYGDKLNILAFPCNQFGHQTNEGNDEFLNTLKHVRPGNGFEPASTVTVFEKVDVNGADSHPLFKWLRSEIVVPCRGEEDTKGNGCPDAEALILPRGGFGGTTVSLWTPVTRSDIAWNFEKFLLDAEGKPVNRYHRYYLVDDIASDIDALLA